MPFRTDYRKSSRCTDLVGKLDVRTTSRHVGGNGNGALLSGMSDYLRLLGMLLGIEHLVLDTSHLEHAAEQFRSLDIRSTDEDRASCRCQLHDFVYDSLVFGLLRPCI